MCGWNAANYNSYHVNIPMTGHIESEHRGVRVTADSEYATVYQPEMYTVLPYWSAQTRLLCAKFDRSVVDDALRDALGNTATAQINFGHTMQIHSGGGRAWAQMVQDVLRPGSAGRTAFCVSHWSGCPLSTASSVACCRCRPPVPQCRRQTRQTPRSRLVATAVEIIEADAHLPLTVSSIAARSRGSVRALQQAFRRELETTPMAYLREVRLRRAHRALVEADPSVTTVASIAYRLGLHESGPVRANARGTLWGTAGRDLAPNAVPSLRRRGGGAASASGQRTEY